MQYNGCECFISAVCNGQRMLTDVIDVNYICWDTKNPGKTNTRPICRGP